LRLFCYEVAGIALLLFLSEASFRASVWNTLQNLTVMPVWYFCSKRRPWMRLAEKIWRKAFVTVGDSRVPERHWSQSLLRRSPKSNGWIAPQCVHTGYALVEYRIDVVRWV
jgi:hypothetical protein